MIRKVSSIILIISMIYPSLSHPQSLQEGKIVGKGIPQELIDDYEKVSQKLSKEEVEDLKKILMEIPKEEGKILLKRLVYESPKNIAFIVEKLSKLPVEEKIKFIRIWKIEEVELSPIERYYSLSPFISNRNLKQVGYDINWGKGVGAYMSYSHILGSGDRVLIYIWGKGTAVAEINFPIQTTVSLDGKIFIPKIGLIRVGGLRLSEAEKIVSQAIKRAFQDAEVSITLSSQRTIPVFVSGEVAKPGFVFLTGRNSVIDAIQLAGGILKTGSLRHIKIEREGETINVDLYNFLFLGRISDVPLLRDYDYVYVPPIYKTAAILGDIMKPGIYEIKNEKIEDISKFVGIFPTQYRIRILRDDGNIRQIFFDGDLNSARDFEIKNGDIIELYIIRREGGGEKIFISGYVIDRKDIPFREGLSLFDAVSFCFGFPSYLPPSGYEIIRKDKDGDKLIKEIKDYKNLNDAYNDFKNIKLLGGDRINILPPLKERYPEVLDVQVLGEVRNPGTYFVRRGERIYDAILKAGGFTEYAYPEGLVFLRKSVELAEREKFAKILFFSSKNILYDLMEKYTTKIAEPELIFTTTKDITDISTTGFFGRVILEFESLEKFKNSEYNIELEDGDKIIIPQKPKYVIVGGEVKNPGTFVYREGKNGRYYISLAGGETRFADVSEIYVISPAGRTLKISDEVPPGSTIVVPPKIGIYGFSWTIAKDALSLLFQGITSTALVYSVLKR